MSAPRLHVVVVHWNQPRRLGQVLENLAQQGVDASVEVVDNASDPEAAQAAADLARAWGAAFVETGANLGFGPGANVGLRRWLDGPDDTRWCLLVPHDALLAPGAAARMLEMVEGVDQAGLACADVGDQALPLIDPYLGPVPGPTPAGSGWVDCDYPHGTAMLVRRDCLEQIGLFDERYFTYDEEADLGVRATRAGWRCGLLRGEMVENPSMSTDVALVDYLRLRNTILLLRLHWGRRHAAFRFGVGVCQLVHGLVRPSARPVWFCAGARARALRDVLVGRYGPPPPDVTGTGRAQPRRPSSTATS